jgi:hypothetical protein
MGEGRKGKTPDPDPIRSSGERIRSRRSFHTAEGRSAAEKEATMSARWPGEPRPAACRLPPRRRRVPKKDVEGHRFGSCRGAELQNRRIHLPRPGPLILLPGGLQAVLVHDDHTTFRRGERFLQAAELIVGLSS